MKLSEFHEEQLRKDSEYRRFSDEASDAFEMARRLIELRAFYGLSQAELAKKLGTKQPAIARIENGSNLPSLRLLKNIAKVLGTKLILPGFESLSVLQKISATFESSASQNHRVNEDSSLNKFRVESNIVNSASNYG